MPRFNDPLECAKWWLAIILEQSTRTPDEPTAQKRLEHLEGRLNNLAATALVEIDKLEKEAGND